MGTTIRSVSQAKQAIKEVDGLIRGLSGQRDLLLRKLDDVRKKKKKALRDEKYGRKALAIIQKVAQETQEEIEYYISEIPSLALSAVFENPYKLDIEFVQRNNRTEADFHFLRGEMKIKPLEFSGIGAVDVAAFGLRPTIMNMTKPSVRRVLFLDEAFKHLRGKQENINVVQMIKEMSKELGLQVIMIHDERVPFAEIEKGADRIFKVSIKNNVSNVEVL